MATRATQYLDIAMQSNTTQLYGNMGNTIHLYGNITHIIMATQYMLLQRRATPYSSKGAQEQHKQHHAFSDHTGQCTQKITVNESDKQHIDINICILVAIKS